MDTQPATGPVRQSFSKSQTWLAAAVVGAGVAVAYWSVFQKLIHTWATDENYSHGFLIVPLAAYFAWERRERLATLPPKPSFVGLGIMLVGLAALAGGTLGVELFLERASLILVLSGTILFILGWGHLRQLAFPLLFLLLMIPIPAIVFNQIAFPLQLIASQLGELGLRMAEIPVLREGNVIVLAKASLQVAEACSGIRSLVALLTLSIVYAHFAEEQRLLRFALAIMTVPIAIVVNGTRVAAIGVTAHLYGVEAAEGLFHTFSGWILFFAAFALLMVVHRLLQFRSRPFRSVAAA